MDSRKFTKRIEVWQDIFVIDDFSNSVNTPIKIASSWANITTINANNRLNRSTDNGITNSTNVIKIVVRKRKDLTYNNLNQFIKYRGDKYIISNQPYEVGFNNLFIEIIATKEQLKSVETVTPINQHQHQNQNGQGGN